MSGVTKRIEEAVKALDQKQLKKALYLTDKPGLENHHSWIEQAARTCLASKDDSAACNQAIKIARDKLQDTITIPMESIDLEGIEEYLSPQEGKPVENTEEVKTGETNEGVEEDCEECHIADAAVKFVIIAEQDKCDGATAMGKLQPCLDDQMTPPMKWLKTMIEVTEESTCDKPKYTEVLEDLTGYLQTKDSQILKSLDEKD